MNPRHFWRMAFAGRLRERPSRTKRLVASEIIYTDELRLITVLVQTKESSNLHPTFLFRFYICASVERYFELQKE